MSLLDTLEKTLSKVTRSMERIPEALAAAGDYILQTLRRVFDSILRVLKRAAQLTYRFLRDLAINILRTAWTLLGLLAIPLFFIFLWGFGRELGGAGHRFFGWSLQLVGLIGTALFGVALLASFAKKAPATEEESASPRRYPHVVFGLLNCLCIGLLVAFSYGYHYKYSNLVLDFAETTSSRFIAWLPLLGSGPPPFSWIHRAAVASLQPPQLPDSVASQLQTQARFVDGSAVLVMIHNPTDWTVTGIKTVFHGSKDRLHPPTWERTCYMEMLVRPQETRELRCQLGAVDLTQGWRWEYTVWGLPR